ncbi:deoxyguanosinetriphosphate triphosphohydrolase [Boudabousia liubingyangii]|uniref:Deoxyguanosinetriphosphate triphosphohydrolase n=1 Tax=Boudabousia liubingyangii TaxID=1921764 RepID=A0A1Q5PP26_9ACTO|nr:deoxyguanosinetriphosphate triphosphohydrolase [Boudabousia liubingyangii]OKL47791.1 deoxyguanosinetriphosphate triphosphohydrolase [Boudabousia liubingyangii]OKL49175.1 deoxyguanosinetriphosphate triphosphohydrolase [Boudabousia liubingyangii]
MLSVYEYSDFDKARQLSEAPKLPAQYDRRSEFTRDRARILHSSALRRLGAKTQVLGPSSDDFIRTRLTHSLEVAQVGRGLASLLGADQELVDAACLSHDLGHPPFGHNGEKALAQVAKDCGGFEGNAQTLRLLTRLEPKVTGPGNTPLGLNLSRATVDACIKYPWQLGECPKGSHKFGVYPDDLEVFHWAREGAPAMTKCLEAQIMDLADDIGYSVHDVEDAINLGRLNPDPTALTDEVRAQIYTATQSWYGDQFSADDLDAAFNRISSQPWWPRSFDGRYEALAALKNMSSHLIHHFISAAVDQTRGMWGDGPLGRYEGHVEVPAETLAEIIILKGLAAYFVMIPREHEPVYLHQRTLLFDLADVLFERGPEVMEPLYAQQWREHSDDAGRLRAVVDQIAALTDTSASQWHARLCGMLSSQL